MMNLILVKREGWRRQAGRGAVYPVRRGQSEAGGGSGGQRGCLTFRGIRTGLRALGTQAREGLRGRACPSTCPTSLSDLAASSSAHLPWGTSFQNTCYCLVWLEAPSPTLCTTGSVE